MLTPALEQALLQAVQACLPSPPGRCWVAVSGGLDSMVLMHLAARVAVGVRVLHVNHQLSPHAQQWQQQVEASAKGLQLPFFGHVVKVETQGRGLEDAARQARYNAFSQCLVAGDSLLLAHHQDDQAETLLLRLMRGTGLAGMGAMAAQRPLGLGQLLRPLLGFSRRQLTAYAKAHAVPWVDDESNQNTHFDRNFLRVQVMPLLQHRWPAAAQQMRLASQRAQQDYALLQGFLQQQLPSLSPRRHRLGHSIDMAPLMALPPQHQQALLRTWLQQLGVTPPSDAQAQQLQALLHAKADATPLVAFGGMELRRFNNRLYALPPLPAIPKDWQAPWSQNTPVALPLGSFLPATPQALGLAAGSYWVRFRQGGERCQPQGRAHSQSLKKLLQAAQIAPWLRARVPLVYSGQQMVAVGDLWLNEGAPLAEQG